jgi:membrane protein required for colicin V production
MTLVDWIIVCMMVLAVIGGLSQGFFRSVCSLGGLLLGLAIAAWNYGHVAALFMPLIRIRAVADAVAFLVIALLVMALVGAIGSVLAKTFRLLGLGWLDSLAGAVFGFFQGVLMVTLCILVIVAFFPEAHWLAEGKLPRMFFGACHLSSQMTPAELGGRVREGLRELQMESPEWLHPNHG